MDQSDFHDIWNAASPAPLGERRWRVKCIGVPTSPVALPTT